MKPFHFNLEAVRTLRQRQEQKALEQYAQTLLARQQAVERLESAQRELDAASLELADRLETGCAASQISQANDYQRVVIKRRDESMIALGAAERRVNASLQAMLAARQQREIVDKFFDKQKATHQRDLARSEQKMLDDLAGRRGNSLFAWNADPHLS
ncbi:MAG: Flagellar export protein FliJ [Pedosphaera sp.]|nr:Flagellar export protein FliJ [Pedosphaera sp.]